MHKYPVFLALAIISVLAMISSNVVLDLAYSQGAPPPGGAPPEEDTPYVAPTAELPTEEPQTEEPQTEEPQTEEPQTDDGPKDYEPSNTKDDNGKNDDTFGYLNFEIKDNDERNNKDNDRKGSFNEDDFKIERFGLDYDGNPYLTVKGKAGGTVPDNKNIIYAYVFFTKNDNGQGKIYAVTSHHHEDSNEVNDDINYHAHQVKFNEDRCITSINDRAEADYADNIVTVEKTDTGRLNGVATAELTVDDGSVCVTEIFDSAK